MRNVLLPVFFVAGMAASASAAELCEPKPRDQWLSPEEVNAKVQALGILKHVLAFEDGCYEAKIVLENGQRLEIYMDPVTGEVVKIKT